MARSPYYVVIKVGVYMRDVFGPFGKVRSAKIAAQEMAMGDSDDYHEWCVALLRNRPSTPDERGDFIASYRKWEATPFSRFNHYADEEEARSEHKKRGFQLTNPTTTENAHA